MKKRKLLWTGLLLAALYLLMIFLLVAAESAAADANITDLPSAFWYSLTTLTTVGYGDVYPVTAAGKIIGAVFQVLSIGLLAFLIGAAVEILRGRLFPMLRLRFRLKREWYVFSSCGTASAALAASLEKEMKDPVILFLRSGGSEKPPVGMSVNVSPETLLRVKKDAVTVETEAVNFIPTLGKTLVTGPEGDEDNADAVLFLAAGNRLTNPSVVNTPDKQSSYMKGFRAFFQLKGDAAMSNLRAYSIDFGDGEATEIVEVDGGQLAVDSDDSWYDLQGRKLDGEPTTKGVYIKNGKKVVVN